METLSISPLSQVDYDLKWMTDGELLIYGRLANAVVIYDALPVGFVHLQYIQLFHVKPTVILFLAKLFAQLLYAVGIGRL